jgi:hypothetical protein
MLAPSPTATTVSWPQPGDATELLAIVQDQAETISAQFALLHDYQDALDAAQAPPATQATGTASGTPATTLTLINVNGAILIGSSVAGVGVPSGTTITTQQSGTLGGAGVYTTNNPTTASNSVLTFTPGGLPSTWPTPQDAPTLMLLAQQQTAVIRTQTALLQHYQDVLNTSQTPPAP